MRLTLLLLLSGAAASGQLRKIPLSGVFQLPAGVIEISSEIIIPKGAHELEIRGNGAGTIVRASARFRGRAMFACASARRIKFAGFTVDGNRAALARPLGLPPSDVPFSRFYRNSGILAEDGDSLTVSAVRFVNIAGFAILAARCSRVRIEGVRVEDSGGIDASGRNNTTGGILLEEGASEFEIRNCVLRNVRGNGIWTHSRYGSPRNRDGVIAGNDFSGLARDAIQVGHATRVRVESNRGTRIGYPVAEVDPGALPVAIDTAGNTDGSSYVDNRFTEINGKCIDLDGFHHGIVRANHCINRLGREAYPHGHFGIVMNNTNPDMQAEAIVIELNVIDGAVYGGLFLLGTGHKITGNHFTRLNLARCEAAKPGCLFWPDEPDLLRSGIYLGRRAERPAVTRGNVIRDNEISGYRLRCIGAAPGVRLEENTIAGNRCEVGVTGGRP